MIIITNYQPCHCLNIGVGSFFNIGGGRDKPARPTSILGWRGIVKCTYMPARTHTCMHACTCICMNVFIHSHPCMEIIKIKASDLYEKHTQIYTCYFTSSEQSERGKFLVIIMPKNCLNLHTFIHIYY